MLVLIVIVLALVPAVAILYPFVRMSQADTLVDEESPTYPELLRRWEAAVDGLDNAEQDRAIGNLAEDDYRRVREEYMTEAALAMKALDLEEQRQQELLAAMPDEVRRIEEDASGENGPDRRRDDLDE